MNRTTATDMLGQLLSGQATPLDIAHACLERIARREPQVHAWAWHDPQAVLEQARQLGAAPAGRLLYGIPVGVKDIIDTADMPTAYGSAFYADHRPRADAEVVRRLRAAGAIILGKTVTTEFAYAHPGRTVNPFNPARTPGGSSSGSAAAVGDGMTSLALGTQTGGSTIRPSAYCGIVGMKPTHGTIPTDGVRPLAPSMDTVGIHAASVADARLLYSVLSATTPPPRQRAARHPWRIAYCPGFLGERAGDDARQALELARAACHAGGLGIMTCELPPGWAELGELNRIIMAYEAAQANGEAYDQGRDKLGPPTRLLIESGRQVAPGQYRQALEKAATYLRQFEVVMRDVDAILTFSAPGEAPPKEEGTGDSVFNRPWTTIGVPCLTLPCGTGKTGLPLGVQLIAARQRDYALLQIGEHLEAYLPSPHER